MANKILIVDDEPLIRQEVRECLTDENYDCAEAGNANEGLRQILRDPEIAVVITDLQMPGQTGLEMISQARSELPSSRFVEYIVITGHGGYTESIDALRLNVFDFIKKPINADNVVHVVNKAFELTTLRVSDFHFKQALTSDVEAKKVEINLLIHNLKQSYRESLECLAVAAEFKDPETGSHIRRIGEYSALLAAEYGWNKDKQDLIRIAAPLHDVGKIGVPENILHKSGSLSQDEVKIMQNHPLNGYQILSNSQQPVMTMAAQIALCHHERWDGTGYPQQIRGQEIPIEAQITAIADIYDALRSERPYKPPLDHNEVVSILINGDGRTMPAHFNPELLAMFKDVAKGFSEIYSRLVG
ncbi:MAG: response regulator [Gammaproteobacteria bacterium]|nr:response regulator [Gammaproteobacteria bacterium]